MELSCAFDPRGSTPDPVVRVGPGSGDREPRLARPSVAGTGGSRLTDDRRRPA